MGKVVEYLHHGKKVYVDADLKGKHRSHCLCFRCAKFHPEDEENNCNTANLVFAIDVAFGIVTPVWECPEFLKKEQE